MHPSGLFPSVLATVRVKNMHLQAHKVRSAGVGQQWKRWSRPELFAQGLVDVAFLHSCGHAHLLSRDGEERCWGEDEPGGATLEPSFAGYGVRCKGDGADPLSGRGSGPDGIS